MWLRTTSCAASASSGTACRAVELAFGRDWDFARRAEQPHPRAVGANHVGETCREPPGRVPDPVAQVEQLAIAGERAREHQLVRDNECDAHRVSSEQREPAEMTILLNGVDAEDAGERHRTGAEDTVRENTADKATNPLAASTIAICSRRRAIAPSVSG